jgi:hypothetical protein
MNPGLVSKSASGVFKKPEKLFHSPLREYENSDYSIQQKARFVYYVSFIMIGLLIFILLYTAYLQLTSPLYGKLYYPVLIPEFTILLILILCHFLLIKGKFVIAVHTLLVSTMTITWIGMLMDRGDAISRLDSIVFILGLLTALPLIIKSYKRTISIYFIKSGGTFYFY